MTRFGTKVNVTKIDNFGKIMNYDIWQYFFLNQAKGKSMLLKAWLWAIWADRADGMFWHMCQAWFLFLGLTRGRIQLSVGTILYL